MCTEQKQTNRPLFLTISKIFIWPSIVLFIAIYMLVPIRNIIKTSYLKYNTTLYFKIERLGELRGIPSVHLELTPLSYEEIKYFMILCGEGSSETIYYNPSNINNNFFKQVVVVFEQRGFIKIIDMNNKGGLKYITTEKGKKIYSIIFDAFYSDAFCNSISF